MWRSPPGGRRPPAGGTAAPRTRSTSPYDGGAGRLPPPPLTRLQRRWYPGRPSRPAERRPTRPGSWLAPEHPRQKMQSASKAYSSVLVEVPLDRLRVLGLQQRQPEKHPRLLGVEPQRGDGTKAVVVHLHVPTYLAGSHPARAHADDPLLALGGQGVQRALGHVAVAHPRDDQALGAGRGRRIDDLPVHVLIGHDNVHPGQDRALVHAEL